VQRIETIGALIEVLESLGFEKCTDGDFSPGIEKVAVFANGEMPEHVAIQPTNRNGRWVSKLGDLEDIEHELDSLNDGDYGRIVCFLHRSMKDKPRGRRKK